MKKGGGRTPARRKKMHLFRLDSVRGSDSQEDDSQEDAGRLPGTERSESRSARGRGSTGRPASPLSLLLPARPPRPHPYRDLHRRLQKDVGNPGRASRGESGRQRPAGNCPQATVHRRPSTGSRPQVAGGALNPIGPPSRRLPFATVRGRRPPPLLGADNPHGRPVCQVRYKLGAQRPLAGATPCGPAK